MTDEQKLFSEFKPATANDWAARAQKDLRETPLESLNWQTYEGITIKPYYTREDIQNLSFVQQKPGDFPFLRGNAGSDNNWQNIQKIKVEGNGKAAIDKAADALSRGADGVHFIVENPQNFDVAYLAESIDLTLQSVSYTLSGDPAAFLKGLYTLLAEQNISHRNLKGFLNYDPMTGKGALTDSESKAITQVLDLTKDSPDFYGVTVCGTNFSSIGASLTQEVAYTLSAAVAYTDRLTTAGEPLESVLRNMQFCMGAGTNYFFEIAKLRALRLLWAVVVEAYQAEPALAAKLRIHSATSSWYQTTLDPYVNMLRVTTEAMSAVISGADSLTVLPFDSTFKDSDEFSERIARNVSIILKEESYLDKAVDPAAGSYYLDSLTNELASKAWELFREVEAQGGFEAAYESGLILGSITEVSRQKFRDIATGRMVLVGTNKYPNPKEKIDFDPEELIQRAEFDTTRAAYPTEVMRMATELHLRKRKRRPRAVIAVIGQTAKRHINASFAQEFFACAGFETEIQQYEDAEAAADRLLHAAAEVVVVSTSEATYAREFGSKIRQHESKPTMIMADDPQHMKDEMVAHGYDEFIFEDCDMSTILELVQKRLEREEDNHGK
ncbi:methylmalonyl-CoA mutase family protein [Pontibacter ramchanderi]|uniref:Heterodimeric methylmalonyl-CoA mutase small subunit n=1 Tax=Pontibacter ramchanderi TaxID=1179743 RepID=A0A2N3UAY4_9BACT|nr:methylmalonyl-CoA mutase family protein [Pontibacter ramchanderi]PKV66523.1 heterodimeric methylmalonyl-CoA mutase small subunit [Pontibacter ramchanderi]